MTPIETRRRGMRLPVALLLAAILAPAVARAQDRGPGPPPGSGPPADLRDRIEKRMRLARTLGLAEALDLDEAGTARLNAAMAPFDARRRAILEGVRTDVRTLRQAARRGDPKALAGVDAAVQRLFDARAAIVGVDREMFAALSKDLPPEQVARAALFLAQFRQRFGAEMPDVPPPTVR
ncbi:MAG: hypothetical protein WB493_10810 [Anaeromyxobacteraceae bacterium]